MYRLLNILITFALTITCIVNSNEFINASGFKEISPLRCRLLSFNEVGFFIEVMKICTKCKIEKPTSEFHKDKSREDGYYPSCKVCVKEYQINNWNKISKQRKVYKKNNVKKIKTKLINYYEQYV